MKLLLDTNVLVANFLADGVCRAVHDHCVKHHQLVTSDALVDELSRVLREKFDQPDSEVKRASWALRDVAEMVEPREVNASACRDRSDLVVLGTAISGGCVCIVSGDRDLLVLEIFEGIKMVRPADFWRFEAGGNG